MGTDETRMGNRFFETDKVQVCESLAFFLWEAKVAGISEL
jgi:hypothetical protein